MQSALQDSNVEESEIGLGSLFLPARRESVCEFVEEHVELPTGAITGNIRLERIPHAREPLERFADRTARHLVLVAGTQSAKTTILICGMLFRIAKDPEDAMWVFGNADQARDFNKERFMSFAELCKPVNDLIPRTKENVIDKTRWGFRNQHYLSMVLNFIGSGSRTQLSSRPRGLMLMDETDKYAEELKFDAGTIELAEERMKTFPFPLSVKASSPSEKHRMIWAEYEKTDMRQYWVPCPRCGEEILLKMKVETEKLGDCGIRWWHEHPDEAKTDGIWDLKKIKNNAYYKCQKCAGMIHEFERFDMVNNGIWVPSNKQAEEGRYGYQISSLCSVIGPETSLGSIAVKFMSAKGNRMELKNFVNGWLAEPWDESMGYDQGTVKLEAFNENSIPKDGSFAIMATDFQINGFWTLVRKFAPPTPEHPFGQSWLVLADWIQTEDEIDEIKKEYGVLDEDSVLDMARRPNAAAKIIIEHKLRGMWGSPNTKQFWHRQPDGTRVSRPYSQVQYRDPMLGTAWENRTIERAIFVNFAKDAALDAVSALRYAHPTIWHASTNVNPKYARHINAFQKRQVKSKRTGRMEWVWMNVHNEDHLADCECMVTIRAMQRGLIILPPSSGREEAA